jgi:serine/threonine protein kinase
MSESIDGEEKDETELVLHELDSVDIGKDYDDVKALSSLDPLYKCTIDTIELDKYFRYGDIIKERYKVIEKIQFGGFSQVYKVYDLVNKKVRAMKVTKRIIVKYMKYLILREIKIHSGLNHKNIIKMHDYFEDKDYLYIILEYASKGELFTILSKKGKFSESEGKPIILGIIEGLKYLHDNNIIHRDVKLENILINHHGTVKICDFGFAIHKRNAPYYKIYGTASYIAPEIMKIYLNKQIKEGDDEKIIEGYDEKIDIWSLGIIVYEMIMGFHPVYNKDMDPEDLFKHVLGGKLQLMEEKLSFTMQYVILKMLKLEPNKRITLDELKRNISLL